MAFTRRGIEWIEDKAGGPYLHYNKSNYTGGAKIPTYDDIQRIILLERQGLLSTLMKFSSGTTANTQELNQVLREFSTEGTIGQKIIEGLNKRSLVKEKFEDNQIFKTSSDFFLQATPQITADMTKTIDYINNNINLMIAEIAKGAPSFAAAIVQNYYGQGRKNIPDIVKQYIPANCTITQTDLKNSKEISTHLTNIKAKMDLKAFTVEDLIKAVEDNINQISGSFYEQAVQHGFNVANQETLKEIDKTAKKAFNSGNFKTTWTGNIIADDKITYGSKVKGDITVEYSKDGVIYRFGGSIKLRNGKSYFRQKANWLTSLHPRGMSLLEGFNRLTNYGALSAGYGEALLGFKQSDVSDEIWDCIKKGIAAVSIMEALSGLGNRVEDAAGLLIVNNKIFSISDILFKLANMAATSGQRTSAISIKGMPKPQHTDTSSNVFLNAYHRNWMVYNKYLSTKITLWLNMNWFLK